MKLSSNNSLSLTQRASRVKGHSPLVSFDRRAGEMVSPIRGQVGLIQSPAPALFGVREISAAHESSLDLVRGKRNG
jgi:hypothetical protein